MAAALAARAQTSSPKGPAVWLDLDQNALDDAYDQRVWAKNASQLLQRYALLSEDVRQRIGAPKRVSYGATPIEALDFYPTNRARAAVQVFIHGGAWRSGLAKDWGYPAEMLTKAGAHYIALDFINVIEAGGNPMTMADQVRRALAWIHRNADQLDVDPERIYISGHSSGGHLAGVAATTDWRPFGVPANLVKGAVCLSGMYDLKPVRLSARSRYVKFTDEAEEALSSQRHIDRLACPATVAYASLDSPEFQRQSRDFAAAVKAAGKPVQLLVARDYNHFEAPELFGNPYGLLGRAVLEQMRLG